MSKTMTFQDIENLAKQSITKNIEQYVKELVNGTKDPNNFMDITQVESKLGDLINKNKQICLDLTSNILSNIDESELIALKKKEYEELGIHLKISGRETTTILTLHGPLNITRTVLIPEDDDE